MLPCNVVVQEKDGGEVDIAAIDPRVAMKAVEIRACQAASRQRLRGCQRNLKASTRYKRGMIH